MSDIDPASTTGPDGGEATIGPSGTVDRTEHEFEPDYLPPGELPDSDGDGEADIEHVRSMEEIEAQHEADAIWGREQRAAEVAAAEAEAAEQAAQEAAAAAGEPYYLGSGTVEGEPVHFLLLPDGTTATVDENGKVIAVAYPQDPVYVGQVYSGGEALEVYELFDGSQVVVSDGQLVGSLDDVEHDTVPIDSLIAGTMGIDPELGVEEIYTVPMGPDSYDTYVVDAATGETVGELDTGLNLSVPGYDGGDAVAYSPPGADYTMHVEDGEVVDIVPNPEEPEWSFLGIVEYYEDGTVSVDLAVVEVEVDVVGDDMGVSIGVDLFFIEVGAGVEWDSGGDWDFEAFLDLELGDTEFGVGLGLGWEDGELALGADGYVDLQLGILQLETGAGIDITLSEDGAELSYDMRGTLSAFGAYVGTEYEGGVSVGPGGIEADAQAGLIAGHDLLGEIGIHAGVAVGSDGTLGGSSAGAGFGLTGETAEDSPIVPDSMGGARGEAGVWASTDDGLETDASASGREREELDRNGLDTDWHDDMGVGDEVDLSGSAALDAEAGQPGEALSPEGRLRPTRDAGVEHELPVEEMGSEGRHRSVADGADGDPDDPAAGTRVERGPHTTARADIGAHDGADVAADEPAAGASTAADVVADTEERVRDVFDDLPGVEPSLVPPEEATPASLDESRVHPADARRLDGPTDADDAPPSGRPPQEQSSDPVRGVVAADTSLGLADPITDAPAATNAAPVIAAPADAASTAPESAPAAAIAPGNGEPEAAASVTAPPAVDHVVESAEVMADPIVDMSPGEPPREIEALPDPIDTDLPEPEPLA